jgi:hypothetical protein
VSSILSVKSTLMWKILTSWAGQTYERGTVPSAAAAAGRLGHDAPYDSDGGAEPAQLSVLQFYLGPRRRFKRFRSLLWLWATTEMLKSSENQALVVLRRRESTVLAIEVCLFNEILDQAARIQVCDAAECG